jgi:hypothetical protein
MADTETGSMLSQVIIALEAHLLNVAEDIIKRQLLAAKLNILQRRI